MCDYKKMYLLLFNAVTDALDTMQNYVFDDTISHAVEKLKFAQQQCEDIYINPTQNKRDIEDTVPDNN